MASPTQKPILISGAGLASLLLARGLKHHGVPHRIFERDSSLSSRGQGYRLRMSTEGLYAVESVLDAVAWDRFYNACGKTAGAGLQAINARTGEVLQESGAPGPASQSTESDGANKPIVSDTLKSRDNMVVGIARGAMRSIFAEGLDIEFGKHVKAYEMSADGNGVYAVFRDGTKSEEGCMLIGGEGINSYVAKQLSDGKLKVYDTGARGIHGQAPTTAFKGLGEGVFRIVDDENPAGIVSVITNVRNGDMNDPEVEFGWTMIGHPGVIRAPNDDYSLTGETAANIAKNITRDWHSRIRPLFTESIAKEGAFWKITVSSPSGVPQWDNNTRVTVIGDAVHSMTPAMGLGANTALRDSALLSRLLKDGWKEGVTAEYEKEMRVYGSEAVAKSYGSATKMMGVHVDEVKSATLQGEIGDNRSQEKI